MGKVRHCSGKGHCTGNGDRSCIVDETITTVLASMDMGEVLDRTAAVLRRHFGKTRLVINLLCEDEPGRARVLLVDDPELPSPAPGTRFNLQGSICGITVEKRTRQVLEKLDPRHPRVAEEQHLGKHGYGAMVSFPLLIDDRVLGTLEIAHVHTHGLLDRCLDAAEHVARLLAIALHNSQLMEEVRRLNRLLDRENAYLKEQIGQVRRGMRYVAEGPAMQKVMDQVRMVAPSTTTVLIRGETGTGKEGLARLVHELSKGSAGPFVTVNLGAIPETLIESELFGHEKGAFTGADRRKIGRFEQAAGGTIFLDEVGDAPLPVQVKLLRALQERRIERVGGTGSIPVKVRVIAATNRHLEQLMEDGTLRMDLFYRLSAFPIELPPLRHRPEDIRPLALHFLERHAHHMNRKPPRLGDAFWEHLASHSWPGNVRELENYLERALILSPGPVLALPPLSPLEPMAPPEQPPAEVPAVDRFDAAVRRLLEGALDVCDGKIYGPGGAAALLDLKPTTLQGKLRKYGLKASKQAG